VTDTDLLINFAIATVLGALLGTEREHHFLTKERSTFAGIRTFSIVCLAGAVCGYMATPLGPWIVIVGLLVVAALAVTSIIASVMADKHDLGVTTELAFMFTFLVGAAVTQGSRQIGIVLGIALFALLSIKTETRKLSAKVSNEDLFATMKFAIISFVVLPFLPRTTFDPYGVLSFYNIWLMVVLVSAISFSGYVATKALGHKRGLGITAFLGGLWSSTATTITFASRTKQCPELRDSYGLGILIACSTMFPRQLLEVYIVGRPVLMSILLPIGAMGLLGLSISVIWFMRKSWGKESQVEMTNPFSLTPAVKFAVMYAVVLVASRAADVHFGSGGIYAAALLSGLLDVNAITLSVANLAAQGSLEIDVAAKAVVIAAIANTVSKGALAWFFGTSKLFKRVAPWFALILALGAVVLFIF
jgi:uncharacterized membrane protein (DUF4010 family)